MTDQPRPQHLRMIPIDRIEVLNPRARNKRLHREIVDNINAVGLKRPVTVRRHPDDPERYDLVCGEGRLEAFRLLGQEKIPAVVIEAEEADCMVMSLVENIARRQHRPIDLMLEIGNLHQRGYTDVDIAEKIGCTQSWVNMIVTLLERGEERLVAAVETGLIPVSLAVDIARAKGDDVQALLMDAYEAGQIKGKKLGKIRRLLDQRLSQRKTVPDISENRSAIRRWCPDSGSTAANISASSVRSRTPMAKAPIERSAEDDGDPDPTSAGTTGDAALWGGSRVTMGRTANPSGPIEPIQMVGDVLAYLPARG